MAPQRAEPPPLPANPQRGGKAFLPAGLGHLLGRSLDVERECTQVERPVSGESTQGVWVGVLGDAAQGRGPAGGAPASRAALSGRGLALALLGCKH